LKKEIRVEAILEHPEVEMNNMLRKLNDAYENQDERGYESNT
jgi:hypothetical protein